MEGPFPKTQRRLKQARDALPLWTLLGEAALGSVRGPGARCRSAVSLLLPCKASRCPLFRATVCICLPACPREGGRRGKGRKGWRVRVREGGGKEEDRGKGGRGWGGLAGGVAPAPGTHPTEGCNVGLRVSGPGLGGLGKTGHLDLYQALQVTPTAGRTQPWA